MVFLIMLKNDNKFRMSPLVFGKTDSAKTANILADSAYEIFIIHCKNCDAPLRCTEKHFLGKLLRRLFVVGFELVESLVHFSLNKTMRFNIYIVGVHFERHFFLLHQSFFLSSNSDLGVRLLVSTLLLQLCISFS